MKLSKKFEDYQRRLIESLRFFDSFCREHNIKYTVIDGTLLGAVRHKGMIPWDGDVDVALTPKELEKLKKAFERYDGRYYLNYIPNHIYVDKKRKHAFPTLTSKIVDKQCSSGIFGIDVFTIDFLGDDYEYAQETVKKYKQYYNWMRYTTSFHLPERYDEQTGFKAALVRALFPIASFVSRLITPIYEKSYLKFRKERIDNNDEDCKYFSIEPYLNRFGVEENRFLTDGYCDMPFEDFKVMVAKNYDVYLSVTYGNYMQLPPEDKRIPYPSEDFLLSCTFSN